MNAIMIVLLVASLVVFLILRHRRPTVVIGGEMAEGRAREQERLARGDAGPSPLAAVVYDEERGELNLLAPAELPADRTIRELVRRYAAADTSAREAIRYSLSLDDFYTLSAFARRASVFAMRARDAAWIGDALSAVAMMDAERMDYRDVPYTLAYIHHAARRAGLHADFRKASALAAPATAQLMSGFIDDNPPDKDIRGDWLIDDYEGGFISLGMEPYEPARDLAKVAAGIAAVIDRDRFYVESVTIAEELPEVWLRDEAKSLLASVRGGASIHASLRGSRGEQTLMLFLVELPDAQRLLAHVPPAAKRNHGLLAVATDELFCLAVQSPTMADARPVETDESLARFAQPIRDVLGR